MSDSDKRFHSHGMEYLICEYCGHINGKFIETKEFTRKVYEDSNYGDDYKEQTISDYLFRLEKIYLPKADFLKSLLLQENVKLEECEVLDVGAGSGYFVGALQSMNCDAIGIEVSEQQVKFGNSMLGKNKLVFLSDENIVEYIKYTNCKVISFIGVLEHMINLGDVLDAINFNENIRYIFFSVPMFSYSVILEAISPDAYNRQLGGMHTHLFTDKSIAFMCEKNGWKNVSSWKFGTDVADLMRTVMVKLHKENNNDLAELFHTNIVNIIDELQLVIDKSEFASEIHMLWKK